MTTVRWYFTVILITCISSSGCGSKYSLVEKEIKTLMLERMQLPRLTDAVVNGRNQLLTLDGVIAEAMGSREDNSADPVPPPSIADARMVILFDSIVCGPCKVSRIWEYQLIVDYAKTLHGDFEPLFIFAPSKRKEHDLRLALRGHPFEWPVFIDSDQEFLKANPHVPKNRALHTFLLDKNNRVVLVGDPIGNDKLWGLYMKTIRQLIDNDGVLPEESSGKHSKK